MVKNTHCCCKVDGIVRKYENKIQQGKHQILTRCPLSRTSALHGLDGSVLAVLLPVASLPLTGFMPCASLWQVSQGTGNSNILETPLETRLSFHMVSFQGLQLRTALPHAAWPPWLSETMEEESMIHLLLCPLCLDSQHYRLCPLTSAASSA